MLDAEAIEGLEVFNLIAKCATTNDYLLQKQYCPPLDVSLFHAILSDFDLQVSDDLETVKRILNSLLENIESEASEFVSHDHSSDERSGRESPDTWLSATDDTSISRGLSRIDLAEQKDSDANGTAPRKSSPVFFEAQWDSLKPEAKEKMLMDTFPTAKVFDVQWTLKHCKGDVGRAIDELLDQKFLEENGERRKGVEAFSEAETTSKQRRGRNRKRQANKSSIEASIDVHEDTPSGSKWDKGWKDIEYIAERLDVPPQQVSSMYHKCGGSKSALVSSFIDGHIELGLDTQHAPTQRKAQQLALKYPSIALPRLFALVQMTAPSLSNAEDLAQLLVSSSPASARGTPIHIDIRMAPPDLGDTAPTSRNTGYGASSLYPEGAEPYLPTTSKELSALRSQAFTSASSAHRKGKSDHLMGAAAGYYSQVGRDLSARMHASSAAEMDRLVSSQSTSDSCDLHGVDVKNALRISKERVTGWWQHKRGAHTGYTIVTGKGTHSEGGRSRLQPPIAKMLMQEGWKIEVSSGSILVRGVSSGPKKK